MIYNAAPETISSVFEEAIEKYHQRLTDNDVKIGYILSIKFNKDEELIPSIAFKGHPIAAYVKVVSLKDRVYNKFDAIVYVDKFTWDACSEEERLALADHELTHIEFATDKVTGEIKTDDLARPKLKLRNDDFYTNGFYEVMERHGKDCLDFKGIDKIVKNAMEAIKSLIAA